MKVILHADDFGFDKDTVQATIECFENGSLTSATIMPTCIAADLALEYAKRHPEFSFGVHQTYVDGLNPACDAKEIPTLTDEDGLFLESNIVRKKAILLKVNKKEIVKESNAQKVILENYGVKVSHLDSHGHLHKFPSFLLAMKQMKIDGQKKLKLRSVQDIFINNPSATSPITMLNNMFRWYIKKNFLTTDYFYMSANALDTNWGEKILKKMNALPQEATIEIGVHPGHQEEWRQHEFDDINLFAAMLKDSGRHKIINWNDIS